jgi:hypothetical protein
MKIELPHVVYLKDNTVINLKAVSYLDLQKLCKYMSGTQYEKAKQYFRDRDGRTTNK